MTDRIMECITNPVKCKLLLEIYSQGQATADLLSGEIAPSDFILPALLSVAISISGLLIAMKLFNKKQL